MSLADVIESTARVLTALALAAAFLVLLLGGAFLYMDRLWRAIDDGVDASAALPDGADVGHADPAGPLPAAGVAGVAGPPDRDPVIGTDIARAEVHARVAALQGRQAQAHREAHERSLMTRGF